MSATPQARTHLLAQTPDHWAAGPLAYALVIALACKAARAAELAFRFESARPWLLLPATLGEDLMLVAGIGLLGHALGRLRLPRLRLGLTLLVLVPIALLLPADVVAHLLTGRPITFQRLRGDEGATLADLGLLDTADLVGGLAAVVVALAALYPALSYAARLRFLRAVSRPRALLLLLALGLAAHVSQSALLPRTQGLADQPVFVLIESFVERAELSGVEVSSAQWNALLEPAQPVATPGVPELPGQPAKNVVVFLAEGIGFEHTGFAPEFAAKQARDERGRPLPNPTPNLVRRHAQHGLLFSRYYANWHASIQAIFSIVCSAFPPLSGDIVRLKPRIDCGEFSELMAAGGVQPGLFHGGAFNFYNKLALLGRRGYAIELDAEEIGKTSKRRKHQWGIDDRAMVEATLSWIDTLPKDERFAALLIPITAHYPYWVPHDFKRPFKGGSRRDRFLNAVAFQDHVFEQLLRGFEERGLYDDTLFVWLGDHGHYVAEPERATSGLREFYEPNLHTPLVLINPRMFPKSLATRERRSARTGGHTDLLPTLLDALGLPQDLRHQGQSLLSSRFHPRRVFFGARDGRFLGFVEGDHKFVIDTHTKRTEYYDLKSDPDELTDLSERYPERMLRYGEETVTFARGAQARIDAAPLLPEKVSVEHVYELFTEHVAVVLLRGEERIACEGGTCPELGSVLRVKTKHMQGEKRRCVLVKVPAEGSSVELSIAQRDALDLLTGTIFALPGKPKGDAKFRITTLVDSKAERPVVLTRHGAARPRHPRAKRELRFRIERSAAAKKPSEVCLQLTTLGSR